MTTKGKVPGTTNSRGYNADQEAERRQAGAITIGGLEFHPRKKTMRMLDDWNQVSPKEEEIVKEDRDALENFRDLYKQVRVFLEDPEGGQPEIDFLYDNLDLDDAAELLVQLQPTVLSEQSVLRDLPREEAETAT